MVPAPGIPVATLPAGARWLGAAGAGLLPVLFRGVLLVQPWQVSLGLTIATVVPGSFLLIETLQYFNGYWGFLWQHYAFHMVMVPVAAVLLCVFGYYHLARVLFLGDVGSRIGVLDRSIRSGDGGDPELAAALRREETGEFES